MDRSIPGFPVLFNLLKFVQTRPLNWQCYPTISSSFAPFSCPQFFPASGLFQWVCSSHKITCDHFMCPGFLCGRHWVPWVRILRETDGSLIIFNRTQLWNSCNVISVVTGSLHRPQLEVRGVSLSCGRKSMWDGSCGHLWKIPYFYDNVYSSVSQSCPTLWDPMDYSMPGLPVHHQLLELTETHVHWVGDAIQPSHPLSSPSAFNLSGSLQLSQFFTSGGQSIGTSTSLLPVNIQDWFPLGWTGWISLQSNGLSRVFSNTESKSINFSALTETAMAPHSSTLAWKIPWTEEPCGPQSVGSLRVGHDWATSLWLFTFMHWRRKWQPTPAFLPRESQGREPGGLPPMGSHRVRHDWNDLAAAAFFIVQLKSIHDHWKNHNLD